VPQTYGTDSQDETVAVRTRAGLFDFSMLKMVNVPDADALPFLNSLVTAGLAKMRPGESLIIASAIAIAIVDEASGLIDDVLIYVDGLENFRVSHGGGITEEVLARFSEGKDVS